LVIFSSVQRISWYMGGSGVSGFTWGNYTPGVQVERHLEWVISFPTRWITQDIGSNGIQVAVIPNNMFVIIALPEGLTRGISLSIDPCGTCSLESSHERTERMWWTIEAAPFHFS
jgi:hypothetical protein